MNVKRSSNLGDQNYQGYLIQHSQSRVAHMADADDETATHTKVVRAALLSSSASGLCLLYVEVVCKLSFV